MLPGTGRYHPVKFFNLLLGPESAKGLNNLKMPSLFCLLKTSCHVNVGHVQQCCHNRKVTIAACQHETSVSKTWLCIKVHSSFFKLQQTVDDIHVAFAACQDKTSHPLIVWCIDVHSFFFKLQQTVDDVQVVEATCKDEPWPTKLAPTIHFNSFISNSGHHGHNFYLSLKACPHERCFCFPNRVALFYQKVIPLVLNKKLQCLQMTCMKEEGWCQKWVKKCQYSVFIDLTIDKGSGPRSSGFLQKSILKYWQKNSKHWMHCILHNCVHCTHAQAVLHEAQLAI